MTHQSSDVETKAAHPGIPTRTRRSALQAIHDQTGRTVGYELFFRHADDAAEATLQNTAATLQVLAEHTATTVERGSPLYFVNITRDFVVGAAPLPDANQIAVLEVQPDVHVDNAVLHGAEQLRARGYGLALDRYQHGQGNRQERLLRFASHVKLDLHGADDQTLSETAEFVRKHSHAILIGTKIGTKAERQKAIDLGCDLFQGREIEALRIDRKKLLQGSLANYIELLELLAVDDAVIDMSMVAAAVKRDPDLSLRVLRSCNSASFGLKQRVTSIEQATTLLGVKRLRRAVHLGIAQDLATDGDLLELMEYATLADLVGQRLGMAAGSGFLVGMLSQIADAVDTPIGDLLSSIPLTDELNDGLTNRVGAPGQTLSIIESFKRSETLPEPGTDAITLEEIRDLHRQASVAVAGVVGTTDDDDQDVSLWTVFPEVWQGPGPAEDEQPDDAADEEAAFGPAPTSEHLATARSWNMWSLDHARKLVEQASMSEDEFKHEFAVDDRRFQQLMSTNRILVIDMEGERYIPRWQFGASGTVLRGLQEINDNFPGDKLSLAEWLTRPCRGLRGHLPVMLMMQGEHDAVIGHVRALRAW